MSRKTSRRLVYTLSPPSATTHGHILGVNSLALDPTRFESDSVATKDGLGTLYTAGRDGIVTGWGLDHLDLSNHADETDAFDDINPSFTGLGNVDHYITSQRKAATANSKSHAQAAANPYRTHKQLHSNWVNDIALINNYQSLLSCSNDLSVKLWNPRKSSEAPTTIGHHRDYVKCVSSPGQNATWAASGGFDGRIIIWDIAQLKGERLVIDVGQDGKNSRGSIYSLATVNGSLTGGSETNIVAAGGPEAIVKLWDLRTTNPQKPICEFTGHEDNIRSLLVSNCGDLVLSASSDSTIKLWSIRGSKLLNTFSMHDNAVWSLYSNHPELKCFYSADRSGLIVKTDLRICGSEGSPQSDTLFTKNDDDETQGVSTVIANEHLGVSSLLAYGDTIWTTTSKCHINGWKNIDTRVFLKYKEQLKQGDPTSNVHDSRPDLVSQFHQISIDDAPEYTDNESSLPIIKLSSNLPNSKSVTLLSPKTESNADDSDSEKAVNVNFLSLDGGVCLDFNPNHDRPQLLNGDIVLSSNDGHENSFEDEQEFLIDPLFHNPVLTLEGQIGLIKHRSLPNRRHVLTLDSAGKVQLWDLISCRPLEYFDSDEIDEIYNELVVTQQADKNFIDSSTPSWCQISTRSGRLFITLEENSCFTAEIYIDELPDEEIRSLREQFPTLSMGQDQKINLGKWVIKNLLSPFVDLVINNDIRLRTGNPMDGGRPFTFSNGSDNGSDSLYMTQTISSITQDDQNKPKSQSNGEAKSTSTAAAVNPNGFKKFKKFSLGKKGKKANEGGSTVNDVSSESSASDSAKSGPDAENDTLGSVLRSIKNSYDKKNNTHMESLLKTIPSEEVPLFDIPNNIVLLVTEMSPLLGGTTDLYRAKREHLVRDAQLLEEILPSWIGNLLFKNEIVEKVGDKVFFTLRPYVQEPVGDKTTLMISSQRTKLPDLVGNEFSSNTDKKLNNNDKSDSSDLPRLSAQRNLRIRKIQYYAKDKFATKIPDIDPGTPIEDWLELVCQGQVLSPRMNLGMIKTKIWKSSDDMVLMYRRKGEVFK